MICIPQLVCVRRLLVLMLPHTHCYPPHHSSQASTCGRWRHSGSRRRGITLAMTWPRSCRVVSPSSAATARMTPQSLTTRSGLNDNHPPVTLTSTFKSFLHSFKRHLRSFSSQVTLSLSMRVYIQTPITFLDPFLSFYPILFRSEVQRGMCTHTHTHMSALNWCTNTSVS